MLALPTNLNVTRQLMAVLDVLQAALPGSEVEFRDVWQVHVPRTLYERHTKEAIEGIVEVTVKPNSFCSELILKVRVVVERRSQLAFYASVTGLGDPRLTNTIEAAQRAKFFDLGLAN